MFGCRAIGRIARPAVFGCPAHGVTVRLMSYMAITTPVAAGNLSVIPKVALATPMSADCEAAASPAARTSGRRRNRSRGMPTATSTGTVGIRLGPLVRAGQFHPASPPAAPRDRFWSGREFVPTGEFAPRFARVALWLVAHP